ncbi:MAG: M23 family metallopeptidase [Clostridium sp.]|nr:M23 family metallopeptidase [Clostridium sp.]
MKRIKIIIFLEILTVLLLLGHYAFRSNPASPAGLENQTDFIKWVDFTVPQEALTQAFRMDVATCQQDPHLNWVDLLAYLGARYGGDFSRYRSSDLTQLAEKIKDGASLEELTGNLKYYSYYREAYGAVLDGMVGLYEIQIPESEAPAFALSDAQINEGDPSHKETTAEAESIPETETVPETESTPDGDRKVWVTKYGLKAFHPLAKNFPYSHYDDFGVSRSYGYRRQHLGHDMMGQTGTPVIAVESGRVEAIGWNQYGGWRLGIRSFDKKRYYYYAHLRKNYPYQSVLKEGSLVTAGDVIGYLGRTGYSTTENTNNIDEPHLHFGMQLIFDESQKEGNNEIWIDCYEIVKFLSVNRSETVKKEGTKEWTRVYQMKDPEVGEITQ